MIWSLAYLMVCKEGKTPPRGSVITNEAGRLRRYTYTELSELKALLSAEGKTLVEHASSNIDKFLPPVADDPCSIDLGDSLLPFDKTQENMPASDNLMAVAAGAQRQDAASVLSLKRASFHNMNLQKHSDVIEISDSPPKRQAKTMSIQAEVLIAAKIEQGIEAALLSGEAMSSNPLAAAVGSSVADVGALRPVLAEPVGFDLDDMGGDFWEGSLFDAA